MSRHVKLVLLCEDKQQETFLRRFLSGKGWDRREIYVKPWPGGRGAGEHFVRQQFPRELKAHRSRPVSQALVTMIDGDRHGAMARLEQLNEACREDKIEVRRRDEQVAVFVPTWNIETWLAYLDGDTVDETRSDYPRFRGRERECQRHVNVLNEMCQASALRQPSPPSLDLACDEYHRLVRR